MIATGRVRTQKCHPDNNTDLNPMTPSSSAKPELGFRSLADEAGHITSRLLCHLDKDISIIKDKLAQLETCQSGTNSELLKLGVNMNKNLIPLHFSIHDCRTKIGAVGETVEVLKAYMEDGLTKDTTGILRREALRPEAPLLNERFSPIYLSIILGVLFLNLLVPLMW
ncbi:hypothetical protein HOY80DRAFT_1080256 [Tuber brumale]|nr:hypothetical protein HOY80DRAFT_1080256 [Tuber brumale]